jgi:hypothetical protein
MTKCPKFAEMKKMFQGENASTSYGKMVIIVNIVIA